MKSCKFCDSLSIVKYGMSGKSQQRYICKECHRAQISRDLRCVYSNEIKRAAIVLYIEGNGLRGTARILNQLFNLELSFQTVSHWISAAEELVAEEAVERKKESPSIAKENVATVKD